MTTFVVIYGSYSLNKEWEISRFTDLEEAFAAFDKLTAIRHKDEYVVLSSKPGNEPG